MKKVTMTGIAAATLALAACGGAETGADESSEVAVDDDNDAPEPSEEAHDDEHEHDEGTDPDHAH